MKNVPRYLLLTLGYALLLQLAFVCSLLLHFEGGVPERAWRGYLTAAPYFTVLSLAGYYLAGLYHALWRYASTVTLFQIVKGVTLSALALLIIALFNYRPLYPFSLIVLVWLWELVLMGGARFAGRLSGDRVLGPLPLRAGRALVVGAAQAGAHLIQEMRRGPAGQEMLQPVGLLDDDPRLTGQQLEGVKVLGTLADLPRVLRERRVEIVIVSDPGLPARVVREIARVCAQEQCRVKTVPGLADLQHGRTALSQMRDVSLEDLLGRQPVQLDLAEVGDLLRDQRVLVTGAGGSIGSELARQVAAYGPASLILLDHAENGLYYIHNELAAPSVPFPIEAVVTDIRDAQGVEEVHRRFRPTVVLHAAAHKHVPLLEANPREAVLNNVVGTRHLLDAAERHGVEKFVLISTDKAVNPSSVMGASKRVCELLMQLRSRHSSTRFAAVRFGNVLGSEGSVVPLFQRQIQRGGPLTVTHPEARRYFMTIPEAVRLVLQAGAMGRGGEVFLLDMGEQVRIADLARQLVRMAGLREGEDIEIVYTGLRPGEKLSEELHSDAERMRMTRHERILVWDLDAGSEEDVLREVAELEALALAGDHEGVRRQFHRIVPEYHEPQHEAEAPVSDEGLVQLPAAQPAAPAGTALAERLDAVRQTLDQALALVLLALSAPLWLLLWVEVRSGAGRTLLRRETCVGRTRRRAQRRVDRAVTAIDRRIVERRTRDLSGAPISCARFRCDQGTFGRWLGRRGLDRLPLLLNVLRREMALVGPRPQLQDAVPNRQDGVPDYGEVFSVRPGFTGLAQVSGCEDGDPAEAQRGLRYDLFYVGHRSLLLDIRLLLRTVRIVFSPGRAGRPARDGRDPAARPAVKQVTR